jgi:hypothetical protein
MNSLRSDLETNPFADRAGQKQAAKPVPIDRRPLDNEYAWKGNPYQMDGWLKPAITAFEFSCDDPLVAWFSDAQGRLYTTRDGMKSWDDRSAGLMGAHVRNIAPSPTRTFVLYAETDHGTLFTRDGGLSWHSGDGESVPTFRKPDFLAWQKGAGFELRIDSGNRLLRRSGAGDGEPAMTGWRIPRATSVFMTPHGVIAAGPGGAYTSADGKTWNPLRLWRESETGAADFLHAYWMGRYYHYIQ